MLNLLRMNLFRMVHTKAVIVVFVLLMAFSVINGCMSAYDSEEAMDAMAQSASVSRSVGDGNDIAGVNGDMAGGEENWKDTDGANSDTTGGEENRKDTANANGDTAGTGEAGDNTDENSLAYDTGYEMGQKAAGIGIYMETPLNNDGSIQDYLLLYCEELSGGIILIFVLIASLIFFRGDEKNGFVKNIAGQTRYKVEIFLSKFIAIAIFTLVSMLCYMLVEFAAFKFDWLIGVDISFGMAHLKEALKVFAIEYLLYMAFISGLLLLTELTKSTAVGITIGLLGLMGFGILFSGLVQKLFHTDSSIAKYYINTSIAQMGVHAEWDAVRLALCVGAVFLVVYNGFHMYWFAKRDIV